MPFAQFIQKPLTLIPIRDDTNDGAYESDNILVPCGTFQNCSLNIDSVNHRLEPVEIKHYSFEIDLYIEGE